MMFSGSAERISAYPGEAGQDPNDLATAKMTLDDLAALAEYASLLEWRESSEHASAIRRSKVTIMMSPEERARFEAHAKRVVRNNVKDALGVLHGGKELLSGNPGCWKAVGALVGIGTLLIALPYVVFFALCIGQALTDDYFNLGAALAAAYLP